MAWKAFTGSNLNNKNVNATGYTMYTIDFDSIAKLNQKKLKDF